MTAPCEDDVVPGAAPVGLAAGVDTALLVMPMLLTEKPVVDTPAALAMVWNVEVSDTPRLAAGSAERVVRALDSAARLAAVAASPDGGGRTVASQVTSVLRASS